jgi:hypothetical protein
MTMKTDFLCTMPTLNQMNLVISAKMFVGIAPKISVFISQVVHQQFIQAIVANERSSHTAHFHSMNVLESDCHRNEYREVNCIMASIYNQMLVTMQRCSAWFK